MNSEAPESGRPLYLVMKDIIAALSPKYGEGEAKAMVRLIFENLKGWTPVDLAIKANEPVSDFIQGKIRNVVDRALQSEPLQYIFGNAWFYGMNIKVTPDVLIPRPETAQLVDRIVDDNPGKDLRVIDLGTGSGCIALALSRNLAFSDVMALDISEKALDVARENADKLKAGVRFIQGDILNLQAVKELDNRKFDIIVSNPPYIADHERGQMEDNVLLHEPSLALFVPDSDTLKFYVPILLFAADHLAPGGHVYFEINPLYAKELADKAKSIGFGNVELMKDFQGSDRFLIASR